jgi:antitoxin (DNA-binding transcriptional repressor) of toxin-antitoxin stability system
MIEAMGTLRITEAELARDIHAVLAKVQEGAEVIVEQDHRPVAVIRTPLAMGRLLSECIALAEARGSTVTLDEGFMNDVEEGIASRSQPWNPPSWEFR